MAIPLLGGIVLNLGCTWDSPEELKKYWALTPEILKYAICGAAWTMETFKAPQRMPNCSRG